MSGGRSWSYPERRGHAPESLNGLWEWKTWKRVGYGKNQVRFSTAGPQQTPSANADYGKPVRETEKILVQLTGSAETLVLGRCPKRFVAKVTTELIVASFSFTLSWIQDRFQFHWGLLSKVICGTLQMTLSKAMSVPTPTRREMRIERS
jgi:hypothetical protein